MERHTMVFRRRPRLMMVLIALVTLAGCHSAGGQALVPGAGAGNAKTQPYPLSKAPGSATFTHLFSFSLNNGAHPEAGLVQLGDSFYGTTQLGGDSNCVGGYSTPGCGVVFKVSPSGEESAMYSFEGGDDGSHPFAPLISVQGNLYGTTIKGGVYCTSSSNDGCGTIFKITPSGQETVLYRFVGGNDGAVPAFYTPLVYVHGALYGVTMTGGAHDAGTLFKVTLAGKESVVYAFKSDSPEASPQGLTFANGSFYGVSQGSGGLYSNDYGSVFKITLAGKENILYEFKGSTDRDGAFPSGSLAALDGTLYGTTFGGGVSKCGSWGCGTIFSITSDGTEKALHQFDPEKEGVQPYSGLITAKGVLYGTNCCAGPLGGGTIFKATTTGQVTILHAFTSYSKEGSFPYGAPIIANGKLYGTTGNGGNKKPGHYKYGYGTIFSVSE